jgi:hypothetical protein
MNAIDRATLQRLQGLTTADLDLRVCQMPGCGCDAHALPLRPRCHPGAAMEVWYVPGKIVLRCAACRQPGLVIAVATARRRAGDGGPLETRR